MKFYPSLKEFLNTPVVFLNEDAHVKIEDQPFVMGREDPTLKIDMKHLKKEIESARTAIVAQSPLFMPYVHAFYPIFTWHVPTMATDGTRLFINPEFAFKLTWEQIIFVLIHEIMHCILMHMARVKTRDPFVFNIAGDFEINAIIVDTFSSPTPKKGDFDEKFVKELKGLYDIKYLNMPVEAIYADVMKNPPRQPKPPKQKPQPQPIKIEVGMKVRIKATGKPGIISKMNPDGTYEISPLNEAFIFRLLNESYQRDEFIPILPPNKGGGPQGPKTPTDDEYEQEKGEDDGKGEKDDDDDIDEPNGPEGQGPDGPSKDGKGGKGYKDLRSDEEKNAGPTGPDDEYQDSVPDPGATGSVISPSLGQKIAKASGYAENEIGPLEDPTDTWRIEGSKMLDRAEKSNPNQSGKGKGSALVNALYRLHRGDVDWKSLFKRFVATALSPETETRIGNKKHLGGDILRYGEKSKFESLSNIVVCVDVSGSMGSKSLEKILNEINQIIFSKRVNKITIIFFDDGVDDKSVQTVKKMGKPWMPKNISGGGGTSFQKPLDWIQEHLHDNVALCVFFTDGGAANPKKPRYAQKFIWMVYDNPSWKQPFGRMVNMGNIPTN